MKYAETLLLEVKVLDDGAVIARRKDGKCLSQKDSEEALALADRTPGVTIEDVFRVFSSGCRIVSR